MRNQKDKGLAVMSHPLLKAQELDPTYGSVSSNSFDISNILLPLNSRAARSANTDQLMKKKITYEG
ncbi:MAG TPA: hypothetical protein VLX29_04525 [Nitrospirota bacterium]|nr:hypothetical protein [Nitrospirota bacterium]